MHVFLLLAVDATNDLTVALAALRQLHVEEMLLPVLVQLVVIILAARLFAKLFRKLGQPSVVGEIAAGLILGPSCLGYFFPQLAEAIFHPHWHSPELPHALFDATMNWIFSTMSQVGLILLLFLIGLEFDFRHLRAHGKAAIMISLAGILLPFALGAGVAVLLHPIIEPHPLSQQVPGLSSLALFLGTAMSITALPILGRMMLELNITRTRIGAITISAAASDDAAGWTLLAAVSAIVGGGFQLSTTLWMIAETLAFAFGMHLLIKPLLCRWTRWTLKRNRGEIGVDSLAILLCVIFGCAIVTNLIGIFAIFGAFSVGAVLSEEAEFREAVNRRLRDLVTAFFLPIFFTYTGLRTDIGSLKSTQLWLLCGLVLAAAVVGKFGGCSLAAWGSGFSKREAACIGTMMNTRALMELIVINVGYQLQVIPPSVFCMLVIMALVTTAMTTPILLRLMRGTELEPYILQSRFLNADGI
ncbi:MAG: cation:proton antiporter [Planctomycetota bacterium]|nr:cation:proton antiporter [Planctomycetota bacterium]